MDRTIFLPTSGGTGSFVVSAAVTGYLTPAESGAVDGDSYRYAAETRNATTGAVIDWEVGTGVYTSATTTLTRVVEFSSNSNATVDFSSAPNVMLTVLAADFGATSLTAGSTTISSGTIGGILYDGGPGTLQEDAALLRSASGQLTIGKESTVTGSVAIKGTISGTSTWTVNDAAGTHTFKLPDSVGTNGYVLQTDGSDPAILSWVPQSGSSGSLTVDSTTVSSGIAKHVFYETTGNLFGEAANFTIESGNPNVTADNAYLYDGEIVIQGITANTVWFFGQAGNVTTTATDVIGIGADCLISLTSGNRNVGIGSNVMSLMESGVNNVAVGANCIQNDTASDGNVAIGFGCLQNYDPGAGNGGNVAIGSQAMLSATGGNENFAMGANALQFCESGGNSNVAIGTHSLISNTTGNNNVGLGSASLEDNTVGTHNIGMGMTALGNCDDGDNNIAIGNNSGLGIVSGNNNICLGHVSAQGGDRTYCIAIGESTLHDTTGTGNIAIGISSGYSVSSGTKNILIGYSDDTSASYGQVTTGSNNISIGIDVAVASATADNQLCIGNYIYGTGLSGTGSSVSSGKIGIGIKAPTYNLDVSGSLGCSEAGAILHNSTTVTGGSTANVPTLTSGPVNGNPTKWLPYDDNGTTRYIPSW